MKICINGGHCPGLDSGAVSAKGLQEANVVRDMMTLVHGYLQQVGYEVLSVQKNDLQAICDASNSYGADLFVSIHCNSAGSAIAKGTEVWYNDGSVVGLKLAKCILNQILDSLQVVNRGVKDAVPGVNGLYVLKNTDCPAVLVETAFISNLEDEELLASDQGKDDFAKAIARGITDYVATL